jgi:hypothetical protein
MKENNPSMVKKILIRLLVLTVAVAIYSCEKKSKKTDPAVAKLEVKALTEQGTLHDGDIIFQTSASQQSKAIQAATHSKYSHCGLLFRADTGAKNWYVIEAVQPVKWTPLDAWISKGEGGHYVIKRLALDPPLPLQMMSELHAIAQTYIGKDYDLFFGWGDDRIYCSELVWKCYYRLNKFELGQLQELQEFDLSNPLVQKKMQQRYGEKIPLHEKVISPVAIFNCTALETVTDK